MPTIHPPAHDRSGLPPESGGACGPTPPDEALELEAATWAVRSRGGLDAHDRLRLQAWLAADPRHVQAFDALSGTLRAVRQMPEHEAARLRAGLPGRSGPPAWQAFMRPFVAPVATAALVLATAAAGWYGWWLQPTFDQSYASARGQQVAVTLSDDMAEGSRLQLDSATRLQARLYRDRREVRLDDGQAMFAVHSDPSRPFHVLAGGLRITVVGTRFSVRHTASGMDAGRTIVAVQEGRVHVQRQAGEPSATGKAPMVELAAGQMLEGSADGDAGLGTVSPIDPLAVAPWRSGRISFNQTRLDQALAEFERYGPTGLVVRDPAVAALAVGGSYGLRQSHRFAEFLPQLLPVKLVQRDGITEIVAR